MKFGEKISSSKLVESKGMKAMVLVLFLHPEMLYSDHIQDKYDTINNVLFNISLRCTATAHVDVPGYK